MDPTGPYAHPHAIPLHGTMAPSGKLRTIVLDGQPCRVKVVKPRWDQGPEHHIVGELYSYWEAYLVDGRHAMLACSGTDRRWWLLGVAPGHVAFPERVNVRH
jgi:hypothetical protein